MAGIADQRPSSDAATGTSDAGPGSGPLGKRHGPDDRRRCFQDQVARLLDKLYGTALRLTRNRADAEDLVAETLAKAWASLPSLQDPQSFEKWVFRILVNTFISDRRRKRPSAVGSLDDGGDGEPGFSLFAKLHQPFLLWWGNPEQNFIDKILREDIEKAIDGLPEGYRIVFILVEIHGFSYAEVADHLEAPVGTVRSRLNRARSQLQKALWSQASEIGLNRTQEKGIQQ